MIVGYYRKPYPNINNPTQPTTHPPHSFPFLPPFPSLPVPSLPPHVLPTPPPSFPTATKKQVDRNALSGACFM